MKQVIIGKIIYIIKVKRIKISLLLFKTNILGIFFISIFKNRDYIKINKKIEYKPPFKVVVYIITIYLKITFTALSISVSPLVTSLHNKYKTPKIMIKPITIIANFHILLILFLLILIYIMIKIFNSYVIIIT